MYFESGPSVSALGHSVTKIPPKLVSASNRADQKMHTDFKVKEADTSGEMMQSGMVRIREVNSKRPLANQTSPKRLESSMR